jgi:hypothetical protein
MPERQASGWRRAARDRGALSLLARCPLVVPVLLVPSWVTWLTIERDLHDTDHPLFYHIPDLTRDPLAVLVNLVITPLVNTETDQVILITVLIGTFGVMVERRFGAAAARALSCAPPPAGALGGGAAEAAVSAAGRDPGELPPRHQRTVAPRPHDLVSARQGGERIEAILQGQRAGDDGGGHGPCVLVAVMSWAAPRLRG